jgi:hypothetical protein
LEVGVRERKLPFNGNSEAALTASNSPGNKKALPIFADIREKRLELMADARKVRVGGLGIDVGGDVYHIETEGASGGVIREMMHIAESQV